MKLAEALMIRGQMQNKLASLKERIKHNILVQEGETPHEDATELMAQASAVLDELEGLVSRINACNLTARLTDGRTITQLLARRDKLAARHAILNTAIAASRNEAERYSFREIKWNTTVDVASLQKQADDLATKLRELNTVLQQANWTIDLPESHT
jgi:flagellar biosynthesis/type III secretory pathway chaperone